jgi:hypothetical protein
VHSETLSQNKQTQGEEMNQALYAHMKNKRKMKKKYLKCPIGLSLP